MLSRPCRIDAACPNQCRHYTPNNRSKGRTQPRSQRKRRQQTNRSRQEGTKRLTSQHQAPAGASYLHPYIHYSGDFVSFPLACFRVSAARTFTSNLAKFFSISRPFPERMSSLTWSQSQRKTPSQHELVWTRSVRWEPGSTRWAPHDLFSCSPGTVSTESCRYQY